MIRGLYDWVIGWHESPYASIALFILAFAESSFFPVPPDVLLIALSLGEPGRGGFFATICTGGSVLGGAFGYLIGYTGGKVLLRRLISKEKIDLVHRYFEKYEAWAIGIAGFTPVPYKIFTISAGAFYINFKKFAFVSLLSRGARFYMVAGLIYLFGPRINKFIDSYFNILTVIFILLLLGGFYVVKVLAKRKMVIPASPAGGTENVKDI